jgi:hypothetical protein
MSRKLSQVFSMQRVDRGLGVIFGVAVATVGEAKGHDLWLDAKTLLQVKECAEKYANGVKVKADHGSGVFNTTGHLKQFRVDGDVLRADLHVLKTEKDRDKLFEMAETIPDTFGLSLSFDGPDEKIKGKMFARCSEIYSTDIVSEAAANPSGLFSRKDDSGLKALETLFDKHIDNTRKSMSTKAGAADENEDPMTAFGKKFDAFASNMDERMKKLEAKKPADEEASEEDAAKALALLTESHKQFGVRLEALAVKNKFAAPVVNTPTDGAAAAAAAKELVKTPAQKGFAVLVQEAMAADKNLSKSAAVLKVSAEHPEVHKEFVSKGARAL